MRDREHAPKFKGGHGTYRVKCKCGWQASADSVHEIDRAYRDHARVRSIGTNPTLIQAAYEKALVHGPSDVAEMNRVIGDATEGIADDMADEVQLNKRTRTIAWLEAEYRWRHNVKDWLKQEDWEKRLAARLAHEEREAEMAGKRATPQHPPRTRGILRSVLDYAQEHPNQVLTAEKVAKALRYQQKSVVQTMSYMAKMKLLDRVARGAYMHPGTRGTPPLPDLAELEPKLVQVNHLVGVSGRTLWEEVDRLEDGRILLISEDRKTVAIAEPIK